MTMEFEVYQNNIGWRGHQLFWQRRRILVLCAIFYPDSANNLLALEHKVSQHYSNYDAQYKEYLLSAKEMLADSYTLKAKKATANSIFGINVEEADKQDNVTYQAIYQSGNDIFSSLNNVLNNNSVRWPNEIETKIVFSNQFVTEENYALANQLLTEALQRLFKIYSEGTKDEAPAHLIQYLPQIEKKIEDLFKEKVKICASLKNCSSTDKNNNTVKCLAELESYTFLRYQGGEYRGWGTSTYSREHKLTATLACYDDIVMHGHIKQTTLDAHPALLNKRLGERVVRIRKTLPTPIPPTDYPYITSTNFVKTGKSLAPTYPSISSSIPVISSSSSSIFSLF